MRDWRTNKGLIVSAGAHGALLAATLVAFSSTPPFDESVEAIPVEMISDATLSQITKGEKTAKVVKPSPKVDRVAELHEPKPLPPTSEALKDVPLPPPPLKRLADPGDDDKPEKSPEPREAQKVAALPPPRPAPETKPEPTPPPRPQAAKPVPEEKLEPADAEPVRPKPVDRPKDLAKDLAKEEAKPTPPKPQPKPPLKVDEVAKLLEKAKPEPKAKAELPTAKPKSGDEATEPPSKLDLSVISRLLDRDKVARKPATGAQLQQTASLGAPTASATRMSPSMWDSLAGIIADQYQRCWSQSGRSQELGYWPVVRVQLRVDGGLAATPVLTNPAGDADRRALGEAAIRAVRMCDPLRIPAQFASFHAEWRSLPIKMRTEN